MSKTIKKLNNTKQHNTQNEQTTKSRKSQKPLGMCIRKEAIL